jgi:peroxiredoxin
MELAALQEVVQGITDAGAMLVAISPHRTEHIRQMKKKNNLTFDILTDKENKVAEQFGLVYRLPDYLRELYMQFGIDLPRFNGDDSWTLPIPARFIIDRHSIIHSVDADPDYTVRPEPPELIEKLQNL